MVPTGYGSPKTMGTTEKKDYEELKNVTDDLVDSIVEDTHEHWVADLDSSSQRTKATLLLCVLSVFSWFVVFWMGNKHLWKPRLYMSRFYRSWIFKSCLLGCREVPPSIFFSACLFFSLPVCFFSLFFTELYIHVLTFSAQCTGIPTHLTASTW